MIIDRKNKRHLKEAFAALERQLFYGTGADAGGYAGIADNTLYDGLGDARVVGAGGTLNLSSCFMFCAREDEARVVLGNDGNIEIGDTFLGPYTGSNSKPLIGYYTQSVRMPVSRWIDSLSRAYRQYRCERYDDKAADRRTAQSRVCSIPCEQEAHAYRDEQCCGRYSATQSNHLQPDRISGTVADGMERDPDRLYRSDQVNRNRLDVTGLADLIRG